MALIDWIPKFIRETLNRPPRYKVTAEEWNRLFNLLVEQGDHNATAIQNLRDEVLLRPTSTEVTAVFATKAELIGITQGAVPDGSITVAKLDFDPVTEAELVAALAGFTSGTGLIYTATDAAWTGTKKADALSTDGQCLYASTAAGSATALASLLTTDLTLGRYTLILRARSANNLITADVLKVEVFKNVGGSFVSQTSALFKPSEFSFTTDYDNLYLEFEYKGGAAQDDEVRINMSLLANATVFEVAVDKLTIVPSAIGIVD